MNITAYCITCKTKRDMIVEQQRDIPGDRTEIEGLCSVCKSKLFRIVPRDEKIKLSTDLKENHNEPI